MLQRKFYPVAEIKAEKEGIFEAIVSVFGNIDRDGERMVRGAFTRTLKERGLPPIYWLHSWTQAPIGMSLAAEEREKGLWIRGQLFVDDVVADPFVRRIHAGMRAGAVKEFSFAFLTQGSRVVEEEGEEIREITDVDLIEVGPVTIGANPETELIRVASAGLAFPGYQLVPNAAAETAEAGAIGDASGDKPPTMTAEHLCLLAKGRYDEK